MKHATDEELTEEAKLWDEGKIKPTDPGWIDVDPKTSITFFCSFCSCEQCKTGDTGIAGFKVTHAQTEDGRWICEVCYTYDVCIDAQRAKGKVTGPCENKDCEHRPKIVTAWA